MGLYFMKPDLNVDQYVWWSTYSDSPIMWGTRKDFLKKYKKRKYMFQFGEDFKERLDRCDKTGFSYLHRPNDEGTVRYGNYGDIKIEFIPLLLKIWETDMSMDMDDDRLMWLVDKYDWDE